MKFFTLVALFLLATSPVHADKVSQAKELYEQGNGAFALGKFADAAKLYEQAFETKPEPALLYNAAQAYRQAGNKTRALFLFRNYLTVYGARVANAEKVRGYITHLESELAAVKPAVAPPAAKPAPQAIAPTVHSQLTAIQETTQKPPLYKRWWLWTAVAAVAVGAGLGIGLGVGLSSTPQTFDAPLGTIGPGALTVH